MQKTTTLKMLKGFLFKMVPIVLILNIFFMVTYAQQKGAKVVPQGKFTQSVAPVFGPTDVPSLNEAFEKNRLSQKNANGKLGSSSLNKGAVINNHGFTNSNGIGALAQSAPSSNVVEDVCVFNGGLVTGDPILGGPRPFRSGVSSSCAAPGACGTPFGTSGYLYDTIRMKNTTCLPQCVTVNYIANAGGGDIFVTAYLGSFNPANVCTNRIADGGSSSLSGGAAVNFSFNLAVDATVIFVINGATAGTQCPSYTMTVTGLDCSTPPACQAPTASVLSQVLMPGAPIVLVNQTFNTAIPLPAGWASQNLSSPVGLTGWFQGNNAVFPGNTAPGYIGANFNNTTGANTISNWLFMPNVTLKNGDVLRFFTRRVASSFPDRLQVRMSTNGASVNAGASNTSVGDFTTLLLDINPTYTTTGYPTAWTQFTATLSGLPAAGISGRIAFRYFVENGGPLGANSDYIGIDDVTYTTSGTSTPTSCVGGTTNLKVDITGGVGPYTVVINTVPPTTPITVTNYNSGDYIPVSPTVTTQYTLTSVSTTACCVGTGNSGTPTVVVSPTAVLPINITALPTTAVCLGDGVLMTVTNGVPITPLNLTQTTGLTVTSGNSVSCNAGGLHTDNSYWRVYNLAPQGIPYPTYSINSVRFGVELSNAAGVGTTQPVTVRLYTQTGAAFPGGTRTLVNTETFNVPDLTLTTFNAVFTAPVVVPSTATIVVEVFTPNGQVAGHRFFLGSNALPETAPLYLNAAACAVPNPVTVASLGFPNMHGHINLEGQYGGGATNPVGWTFLWNPTTGLSNPTSNPVAASPMVTTTYTVIGTAPNGCNTSANYRVVVNQPPTVTAQPNSVVVCATGSASFSVTASGAGPLIYQWQEQVGGIGAWNNLANIAPYSGTNTPTLIINPAGGVLNGNKYRCIVTGICNPAFTSNAATLSVNPLPVVPITPVGPVCGGVAGINGTQLTAGSVAPPVPGSATFTSGTINVAIPEGAFPNRPATAASNVIAVTGIPANATITNITARLNATHDYANDIVAVLKSPTGAVINLDAIGGYQNGAGVNYVNTGFALLPATLPSISTGSAPFTGTWKADLAGATFNVTFPPTTYTLSGGPVGFDPTTTSPAAYIGALGGGAANGNWTLAAYDAGAPDVGNLTKWDLVIDYTTPGTGTGATLTYVWSPITGLYNDPAATVPYTGTDRATVYAAPTTYTVYTVTATNTSTGCVGTNRVVVNYTPPAPTVAPSPVPPMCLGDVAVRLTSSSAVPGNCTTASGTISIPVPDNSAVGAQSTLNVSCVPAGATVTGVSVNFNMANHTYVGDMIFNLKAPNGTIINLIKYMGGTATQAGTYPNSGFVNTTISSTGVNSLATATTTPITGVWRADILNTVPFTVQNPTGFVSTATSWNNVYSVANGAWTLAMADGGPGDFGTLTSWSITINYAVGVPATAATWSPATGLFIDAAATIPYTTGDQRDTVYARPTTIGANTYQVTVNSLPTPDPANPAPIQIVDNGPGNPYPSIINVANYATTGVGVKSVQLTGISHTWSDDVDILLQSPTGQNVVLMSDVGGANSLVGLTYVFDDAGPAMSATGLNPSGTYKPTNNGASDPFPTLGTITQATPTLASFGTSANVNGDWKLYVVDDLGGDFGSISGGWSIKLLPTPFCTSPARTVVVTVNQPIVITSRPVNATVCTDKVTSFSVVATGTNPTYQWQTRTATNPTWSNVVNGAPYSGATTNTLTLTSPSVALNGNFYRVVVGGTAPCGSVTSDSARLTVNPLPTVILTASPYTKLFPGLRTTINSTSSPAAISTGYVWRRNGTIVGGSNPSIVVDIDALGDYTLTVTDINGCVGTSSALTISDSASGRVFIYPNPNNGIFQVRYYSASNTRSPRGINVYDDKGSRIAINQYSNTAPYSRMDVDLRKYSKGVYWIEVVDVNGERLAVGRAVVL